MGNKQTNKEDTVNEEEEKEKGKEGEKKK